MDIRDELVKQFGGEVVQPQTQQNIVDLTGNENQSVELEQPVTQERSDVIDLTGESSLNTEETNVEETQASQPQEGEELSDDEIVLNYLSEKLGRDIDSFDDFNSTSAETESNDFASEQLQVINEYVKNTGRTVQDYLNTQTVDLSNVSDDAVIKEYLQLENPNLTEAELNDYISATYKTDAEEYSSRDTNAGKVQLTKDARAARDYFNQVKEDYAMPTQVEDSGMSDADRGEWLSTMENEVNDLEGLSFSMNDQGEEFTYNLDDDARQEIKSYNSDLENFFDKYVNEGGDWNFDALNTDMYILNNIDKIVRGVANQYRSKGTENVINEIKNPSFAQDRQAAPQKQESTLDMLRRQILG
jgi:hypothetical protein|tara:strand:- start:796 stop:1872 length:1077 start_codon:yes stop_codon:yes gene_type:complete